MEKNEIKTAWTHFWDMHSGGGQKLDWGHIFIEAPEGEARRIFGARFGRDPDNETCDCCGGDYSISESPTLEEATAYHRGCGYSDSEKRYVEQKVGDGLFGGGYGKYRPLSEYIKSDECLVIPAADIKSSERR